MFTAIENALYPVVCDLNAYLSNYVLVFLLIAVGLWYSTARALCRCAASARVCAACSAISRSAARSTRAA